MPRIAAANSCHTCRRRKIRCDGARPMCSRCQRKGAYCDRSNNLIVKLHQPQTAQSKFGQSETPQTFLEDVRIAKLFHIYIKELAPWYDLNDEECAFGRTGAQKALDSPLLFAAMIAFAGIYMHRKAAFPREIAETFHARCLRLLIDLVEDDTAISDGTALASTCLLRSYEILFEETDPNRHLFGASVLVPSVPQLSDHSLLAGGFWNYLREDITYSLIHECPLKLQLDCPFHHSDRDDELANSVSLLLGRTINTYFGSSNDNVLPDLRNWYRQYPRTAFANINTGAPFPVIKMLKDCHVAAIQYYNVATGLLIASERTRLAVDICGLTMGAESDPVVVNSYGPVCLAGQWLAVGDQRIELVSFLERTEKRTGWSVKSIVAKLNQRWEQSDVEYERR